jgi:Zn-dependent protease
MFPSALRVARLHGVDIRIDPSWILVALLVVGSFHLRFVTSAWTVTASLLMAVFGTLGFFGSVLAHELGHAFEARHRGMEVHGITLFLFGGVTEMHMHDHRPRDEFAVAAIGPYTSLVLAAVLGLITAGIDWYLTGLAAVSAVTGLLAWLNLGLTLFNIVPGAPLDGGRVLRAGLWAITGDRIRAMALAARAGQMVAVVLLGGAVWVFGRPGGVILAVWLSAIGLFLLKGATSEHRHARDLWAEAAGPGDPSGPDGPVAERIPA